MTETSSTNNAPLAADIEDDRKPRGKVPRSHWGHVRYLYESKGLTYKEIGALYGDMEPSGIFYVVKQARLQDIPPEEDRPSDDLTVTARKTMSPRRPSASSAFAEQQKKVVEKAAAVEQAVTEVSQNPVAKRIMDASAGVINGIIQFEQNPSTENRENLKQAGKDLTRAWAGTELWMLQVEQVKPSGSSVAANEPVFVREKLPEIA